MTLNYVKEDFSYLKVAGITEIAFPMLCFCDIPTDRIAPHLELYGSYGIGFRKQWGVGEKGMQLVHYLSSGSQFTHDLREALALSIRQSEQIADAGLATLSDFLVTVLAYAKPDHGMNKGQDRWFQDECEWRYIPREGELPPGMPYMIGKPTKTELDNYRKTLWRPETFKLAFEYKDVVALFAPAGEDQEKLRELIGDLNATEEEKKHLIACIKEA